MPTLLSSIWTSGDYSRLKRINKQKRQEALLRLNQERAYRFLDALSGPGRVWLVSKKPVGYGYRHVLEWGGRRLPTMLWDRLEKLRRRDMRVYCIRSGSWGVLQRSGFWRYLRDVEVMGRALPLLDHRLPVDDLRTVKDVEVEASTRGVRLGVGSLGGGRVHIPRVFLRVDENHEELNIHGEEKVDENREELEDSGEEKVDENHWDRCQALYMIMLLYRCVMEMYDRHSGSTIPQDPSDNPDEDSGTVVEIDNEVVIQDGPVVVEGNDAVRVSGTGELVVRG